MVIGNGMIAAAFNSYQAKDEFVIFASGVSDSAHPSSTAFSREKMLLQQSLHESPDKKFVYFSTCSIYDGSMQGSAYVQHKKEMEPWS